MNALIMVIVTVFFILANMMFAYTGREVKYDCRMVDVSPDMPEDVKRMCRSRR